MGGSASGLDGVRSGTLPVPYIGRRPLAVFIFLLHPPFPVPSASTPPPSGAPQTFPAAPFHILNEAPRVPPCPPFSVLWLVALYAFHYLPFCFVASSSIPLEKRRHSLQFCQTGVHSLTCSVGFLACCSCLSYPDLQSPFRNAPAMVHGHLAF